MYEESVRVNLSVDKQNGTDNILKKYVIKLLTEFRPMRYRNKTRYLCGTEGTEFKMA